MKLILTPTNITLLLQMARIILTQTARGCFIYEQKKWLQALDMRLKPQKYVVNVLQSQSGPFVEFDYLTFLKKCYI